LSAFLAQLQADGYDVFIAGPNEKLPPAPGVNAMGDPTFYHRLDSLAPLKGEKRPRDPWADAGVGHSLGSSSAEVSSAADHGRPLFRSKLAAAQTQEEYDQELAAAIAMSISEARSLSPLPREAEDSENPLRVQVRIPQATGAMQRSVRKFKHTDHAYHLFTWVDELLAGTGARPYRLGYSNTLLDREALESAGTTLQDAGLSHSAAVVVHF
jgi:hypothetical protein